MDLKTRYQQELATAEEQIETLLRTERRLIEKRGRGFRHPFYTKKIIKLDNKIFRLSAELEKLCAAGR